MSKEQEVRQAARLLRHDGYRDEADLLEQLQYRSDALLTAFDMALNALARTSKPQDPPDYYESYLRQKKRVEHLQDENARLLGLCNWAAGRLLDGGDTVGHEYVLNLLSKRVPIARPKIEGIDCEGVRPNKGEK